MADKFNISENCSPEQKRLFEAINESLTQLGATADEFDKAFRLLLINKCQLAVDSAAPGLVLKLSKKQQRLLISTSTDVRLGVEQYPMVQQNLRTKVMETRQEGSDADKARDILNVCRTEPKLLKDMLQAMEKKAGRFHVLDPDTLSGIERKIYERARKALPAGATAREDAKQNILQQFADGKPLFDQKGEFYSWQVGGAHLETRAFDDYINEALFSAVNKLVTDKHLPKERFQAVETQLQIILDTIDRIHGHAAPEKPVPSKSIVLAEPALKPEPSPQELAERERLREERLASDIRRQEEALLNFIPYGIAPKVEGIRVRATRTGLPPAERELLDAWRELQRLPQHLNRNFEPHKKLGDALYRDSDAHVLRTLDYICTGKFSSIASPERDALRRQLVEFLSEPVHKLAPQLQTPGLREQLIESNRDHHRQATETFTYTPLLVIAALGTPEMVKDARTIEEWLFPPKKKAPPTPEEAAALRQELRDIAGKALSGAFAEAGKQVPVSLASAYGIGYGAGEQWDKVRKEGEKFINEQNGEQPPFNMLRCNLNMRPGHSATLFLSRWVNESGQRKVDTRQHEVLLGEPQLSRALEMKKRLQSHLFATFPLVEHRRLHAGHFITGDDDFIPNTAPLPDPNRPEPDGMPGRIDKRGGVYVLRLVFPVEGAREPADMEISLGVRQQGDFAEANRRRLTVLKYLEAARDANERLSPQDVRLWLQEAMQQAGAGWQQAESIDLSQHPQVSRTIPVRFPNAEEAVSTLHVENPRLGGTPNAFWTIPVTVSYAGDEIARTSVNTHVRAPEMALRRIDEITEHLKNSLEVYGAQHPDARWQMDPDGHLAQFAVNELPHSQNIDWTRLDRIKDELGYMRQLSVRVSDLKDTGQGRKTFTLTLQRADGSDFLEEDTGRRSGMPLKREFTLQTQVHSQEGEAIAERLRHKIQAGFSKAVEDAYLVRYDSEISRPEPERKSLKGYNSRSIVRLFDGACDAIAHQPDILALGIEPLQDDSRAAAMRTNRNTANYKRR